MDLLTVDGVPASFGTARAVTSYKPPVYTNSLSQNYPNPFNPTTTIAYSIAEAGPVELAIFNVRGQLVKTLVREEQVANIYRVTWDGRNNRGNTIASGVYFYRLRAANFMQTKKMVLIR